MINKIIKYNSVLSLFLILFLLNPLLGFGQYINIQIELEPEFQTEVVSELNFGDIVVGSGEKSIQLGDSNMGIFSVTGINSQSVRLSIDTPSTLTHSDPSITDSIPFDIRASYNNSGENTIQGSEPINGDIAYTVINRNALKNQFEWQTMYVFIYGTIMVGNIQDGVYNGFIRLTVDYE